MKNLHLIKTDKPSRLFLNKMNNKLLLDSDTYSNLEKILPSSKYQNIYITNDDRPKKYDYFISEKNEIIKSSNDHTICNHKKIILSTDEDLIADGIQSINDEFLEWFVNNSSCEEVETSFACLEERQCMCKSNECCSKIGYKIIIPSEVPKQTYLDYFTQGKKYIQQDNLVILAGENETDGMVISDPKNTTGIGHYAEDWNPKAFRLFEEFINEELEEAAENYAREVWGVYYDDVHPDIAITQTQGEISVKDFSRGAKWMQERMFSEEDMKKMYDISCGIISLSYVDDQTENNKRFKELLEQLKKK